MFELIRLWRHCAIHLSLWDRQPVHQHFVVGCSALTDTLLQLYPLMHAQFISMNIVQRLSSKRVCHIVICVQFLIAYSIQKQGEGLGDFTMHTMM